MVGEAPAHNEVSGRGFCTPVMGGPPVGAAAKRAHDALQAISEAQTRAARYWCAGWRCLCWRRSRRGCI